MAAVERRGLRWWQCLTCQGQWIAEAQLLELIRAMNPSARVDELVEFPDGEPCVRCPICGEVTDPVFIDMLRLERCLAHGVWCEAGELELALHPGRKKKLLTAWSGLEQAEAKRKKRR